VIVVGDMKTLAATFKKAFPSQTPVGLFYKILSAFGTISSNPLVAGGSKLSPAV
jgi:hypothetical protein